MLSSSLGGLWAFLGLGERRPVPCGVCKKGPGIGDAEALRCDGQGETDGQSWLASKPRSHSPFSTLHPFPWDVVRAEIPLPTLGRVMFVLGSPGNPIPLCEYSWPQYWSKRPVCVCVCVCIKLIHISVHCKSTIFSLKKYTSNFFKLLWEVGMRISA